MVLLLLSLNLKASSQHSSTRSNHLCLISTEEKPTLSSLMKWDFFLVETENEWDGRQRRVFLYLFFVQCQQFFYVEYLCFKPAPTLIFTFVVSKQRSQTVSYVCAYVMFSHFTFHLIRIVVVDIVLSLQNFSFFSISPFHFSPPLAFSRLKQHFRSLSVSRNSIRMAERRKFHLHFQFLLSLKHCEIYLHFIESLALFFPSYHGAGERVCMLSAVCGWMETDRCQSKGEEERRR